MTIGISKRHILFLCTGNYYRSRFAEELFNYRAQSQGVSWHASSRALALERGLANVGPISRYTIGALTRRDIAPLGAARLPAACTVADLKSADIVVAMKEAEHRLLVRTKFPAWEDRVIYWHVHDIDEANPRDAIEMMDRLVNDLMRNIHSVARA